MLFSVDLLADDEFLFLQTRVVDNDLEHETVHLGLGQGIGTLLLNGVLGSQHQKGGGQFKGVLPDGHLSLLHGLKQRALHLRWRTVDFIRQHKVGKHRAFLHLEGFFLLTINHRTYHVSGQQVRRKLDAAEFRVHQFGKGLDSLGLGQTGHTFQQHMAIAEETDEQRLNQMFLTYNHLVHACHQIGDKCTLTFNPFIQLTDINRICHN